MGIVSIFFGDVGQVGENPRRIRIITTDNYSTVTAAGYLNNKNLQGGNIYKTDIIWMWYGAVVSGGSANPEIVSPGTFNVFIPSFNSQGQIKLGVSSDVLPPSVNSSVLTTTLVGSPTWVGPLTNGQFIVGSTGASPMAATLTAGSGISVTNGAGSIMVSNSNPLPLITNSAVLASNNGGVATWVGPLTNGQIVIGNTGNTPQAGTLTAGTGVSIVNTAGAITINATGSGLNWVTVSGTTQAMAVNTTYVANNGGLVTLTLPSTAVVGDTVGVRGLGAGGWLIAQNSGQLIHFGTSTTTTGVGGSLASSNQYDVITLNCIVANTTWTVDGAPQGNITVV